MYHMIELGPQTIAMISELSKNFFGVIIFVSAMLAIVSMVKSFLRR